MTSTWMRPFKLALAALALTTSGGAHAAATVPLRLMAFNDFHGHLEAANLNLTLPDPAAPGNGVRVATGGAAALSGLIQALRADARHSVLISSGDLIGAAPLVSTLFRHESTIEVMNVMGVDLGALGNHELDAGLAELQRIVKGGCGDNPAAAASTSCALGPYLGARFPMLAANMVDRAGQPVLAPYVVKRIGGVRVGFIGALTRITPSIVMPSGIAGLQFQDEADAINRAARQLRRLGVKALVAVIHEGGEIGEPGQRTDWNDPSCPGARGPIFDINSRLAPEIGVVFSAHTHQGYRCVIDGRVVIQSTSYGRGLAVVDLALDPRSGRFVPARTVSANLPVFNTASDAAVRERLITALPAVFGAALRAAGTDVHIAAQVARHAKAAAPKARQVVGRISEPISRSAEPGDSPAGRLIADAQLAATRASERGGAQIAFMNRGGIRSDLVCPAEPPCDVTFGDLFTMQPFGNSLVVMTLSGRQLKDLLESQQKPGSTQAAFLQPSAGLGYTWQVSAPAGERVVDLRLKGQAIEPDQAYRVTVNSFMAEGGDGFTLLSRGTDRLGGAQDVDALIDYFRTAAAMAPPHERRIRVNP